MEHCWKASDGENSKTLLGKYKGFSVHAMKIFRGRGGTAQLIINFSTRW